VFEYQCPELCKAAQTESAAHGKRGTDLPPIIILTLPLPDENYLVKSAV